MAAYPFQYVNRRGIPVLKTTGVTAETTGVVFSFPNHAFANSWYRGLVRQTARHAATDDGSRLMRRKTINRRRREGPRSLPELSQNH